MTAVRSDLFASKMDERESEAGTVATLLHLSCCLQFDREKLRVFADTRTRLSGRTRLCKGGSRVGTRGGKEGRSGESGGGGSLINDKSRGKRVEGSQRDPRLTTQKGLNDELTVEGN